LNEDGVSVSSDFESISYDITPTANPALGSEQEQVQRATLAKNDAINYPVPGVYNVRGALEDYYTALGYDKDKIDRLLPPPQPNQPDPIVMAQVQAQQQIAAAETLKGEADMISSQAKMIQAQILLAKVASDIEKTESETIKNLSTVEKNQLDGSISESNAMMDKIKKQFDMTRGAFDELNRINQPQIVGEQAAIGGMVTPSSDESV